MERIHHGWLVRIILGAFVIASLVTHMSCGGGGGGGAVGGTAAPSAFNLDSPGNGSVVNLTPTLRWRSASGATTYTIQMTTNSSFTTITTFQSTTVPSGTTSILISGGTLTHDTTYYWRVLAVNAGGSTVASSAPYLFKTNKGTDTGGEVVWSLTNDPSPIDDQSYGMVISGANMFVVGYDSNTTEGDDQWRIEKRTLNDGSLVTSFGTTTPGVVVNNPTGTTIYSFDDAYAVAVDLAALYVVGFDSVAGEDDWGWRIEKRDLVTGASITAFGSSGAVSENINVGPGLDDEAYSVAVDSNPTGTLYVVGYETTVLQGTEWRIEARDKTTGLLTSSVTSSLSSANDFANAIAIDPVERYMYVVGTDSSSGNWGWRIEKRALSAPLSLEAVTFGGGTGYIYEDVSTDSDEPLAIALDPLDPTYMYIVGYETDAVSSKTRWRIEKRLRSDGSLDNTTFGSGTGYVVSGPTPTPTHAAAQAIAIEGNFMYVAGYDNANPGTLEWRVEKRSLATGELDAAFANNGVYINDFGTPSFKDSLRAIAVDASYVYVAGYESVDADNSRWRIEKIVK